MLLCGGGRESRERDAQKRTFISFVSSADAAWNTSLGGDALRSAFFTSGLSAKLIRRFRPCLCDMEWMTEVLSNQEGKARRRWRQVCRAMAQIKRHLF